MQFNVMQWRKKKIYVGKEKEVNIYLFVDKAFFGAFYQRTAV